MRPAKSIATVVKRLTEHRPKTETDLTKLGIRLKYLGNGAFRDVYKVKDIPLVIKFPLCECSKGYTECTGDCGGPDHSRLEYGVYQKIMENRKYRAIRGFMPKVYYFDDKTGIIAVHYYKEMADTVYNHKLCDLIEQFLRQTLSIGGRVDMKPDNVGTDISYDGDIPIYSFKILDLGCVKRGF